MKNKSFTLIELLVVIAMVGLLASIVLVSTKGIRERARIAKTLEFSHSINHVLGAYAVGIWSFDEGDYGTCPSAQDTCDASGYGNDGIVYGASFTPNTPHQVVGTGAEKYALSFDGMDDYVDCGSKTWSLNAITVEAWVNPEVGGGQDFIIYKKSGSYYWALETYSTDDLIWALTGSDMTTYYKIVNNVMTRGAWNHIVATQDGTAVIVYVNGVKKVTGTFTTNINEHTGAGQIIIGDNNLNDFPFGGLIDEVRIYNQALTQAEIQKHYTEELERHRDPISVKLTEIRSLIP